MNAKPHPKYTWLLFDADDTLFDFGKAEANALRRTMEEAGLPFQAEYVGRYARFNQQVWQEFERGQVSSGELRIKRFRLFFDALGIQTDLPAISQRYLHNLALGTDLLEDADRVVHSLKKRYRLALVTNGLQDVQRPRLECSSLRDCFEHVFISEEVGAAKPSPAYFDAVFAALGGPARDSVLIIGDSLTSDMQGGLNYGIHTCWYNPSGAPSELALTYRIKTLAELLALL